MWHHCYKTGWVFAIFTFLLFCQMHLKAQCASAISNFPNTENFEQTNGGWVMGGFLPDWEWGVPQKAVINNSATANKCWVTGGLTGSAYSNGQASWIQSPCYDFTSLRFPLIAFKVFWETELNFDGAALQYSVDYGQSWQVAEAGSENCFSKNWFNSTVRYLSAFPNVSQGWSGSVAASNCASSGGSNGWLTATQALPALAGEKNVIFRFVFAAGTQCNNFDGFAIDDFWVGEASPNSGTAEYQCINDTTAVFLFKTNLCPTSYEWNFGDPASGSNNTTSEKTPSHIFSGPGKYTVTVKVSSAFNEAFTTTVSITILAAQVQLINPIDCLGNATGTLKVQATGGTGSYQYTWLTQPEQYSQTINMLGPGNYTVEVNEIGACPVSANYQLTFSPLQADYIVQNPGCVYTTGKINLFTKGGQAPYSYQWLPQVSDSAQALNLAAGNYTVTITDAAGCTVKKQIEVYLLPKPTVKAIKIADADCNAVDFGKAKAEVTGGTAPFYYNWNTQIQQTQPEIQQLLAGTYTVTVTDSNGCKANDQVTIQKSGICNAVYFPTAFTPNGDGTNDYFGPQGNILDISAYRLMIYNRYGQKVFETTNPLQKWDGMFSNKKQNQGVYIWQVAYLYKTNQPKQYKGTITLFY
ncbi:MAG: hypothetical protein RL172_2515 [Bacteroidota bacterium]|jgi:gliding motility-associated-like protein